MKFKWQIVLTTVVICGLVVIFYVSRSKPSTFNDQIDLIARFSRARKIQNYEQPPSTLIKKISRIYHSEDADQKPPKGTEGTDAIMIDNVPYFPYWQGKEGEFIFHPMGYGGFLDSIECTAPLKKYLDALIGKAHSLPNGGLLWYYPDNFRLNRFLGPDLHPSAISQGRILGGIVHLDHRCNLGLSDLARRIFLGLAFDYYQGGLNLENRALLEIPLFRSAPEIVLNGWLHALLYLSQYAKYYQDQEAYLLLRSNLEFLGKSLEGFHDPRTGLSLYSDLGPYRVKVEPAVEDLVIFYRSRVPEFDDLVFKLDVINHPTRSPYDNQIIRRTKTYIYAQVSCSQRYDTYLVSKEGPFTVSLTTGTYSPKRATPGRGGEKITLQSDVIGDFHVVHLTEVRKKLFCGFPTNFLKWGKENYYHVYHIVALTCLLATEDIPGNTHSEILRWITEWMSTVEKLSNQGYEFTSYEDMLEELHRHQACTIAKDWESLLIKAKQSYRR